MPEPPTVITSRGIEIFQFYDLARSIFPRKNQYVRKIFFKPLIFRRTKGDYWRQVTVPKKLNADFNDLALWAVPTNS